MRSYVDVGLASSEFLGTCDGKIISLLVVKFVTSSSQNLPSRLIVGILFLTMFFSFHMLRPSPTYHATAMKCQNAVQGDHSNIAYTVF